VRPLLEEALDLPPDRVAAFLAEACADDVPLRRQVEALLRADARAGRFLEDSALHVASAPPPDADEAKVTGERGDDVTPPDDLQPPRRRS
jgi:hypothetical protein